MKFEKIKLTKEKKEIPDLMGEPILKSFVFQGIKLITVELIKISGVKDPSTLTLSFQIVDQKYSLPFFRHRMNLLFEREYYYLDTSKMEKLRDLEIANVYFLQVTNEDETEDFEVVLFYSAEIKGRQSSIEYL